MALLNRSLSCPAVPAAVPFTIHSRPLHRATLMGGHNQSVLCAPAPRRGLAISRVAAQQTRGRRHAVVVRANWGAPVEFTAAKIKGSKELAPGLFQLMVDVPAAVATTYTKPGQYIQAKVAADAKPGFFAIASKPGAHGSTLELLIKTAAPGSTAEAITGLKEGGELMVSPAQGKGFPVDKIPSDAVKRVLLFATGSGISPIKAVIESGVLEPSKRSEVKLYYGARSKGAAAYNELIPAWEAAGVKVVAVYSEGTKNYVQNVLQKEADDGHLNDGAATGVLLCGQKEMAQAVTAILTSRGVAAERILSNF